MDAPEEIKTRLDIVDLIADYLTLKPAGSGAFKACCPFHQEKTPSFYVSRPRQSWHCFGCDTGGDHFSFVEKMEGLDFREALELLASKTGVTLPEFDKEKSTARKRLYEVNDLAVKFFRGALATRPDAEHAREYLKKRGIDHLTEDLFKLGYAPAGWSTLSDALMQKGVTADELIRAGLSSPRQQGGSGVYDRFRDRITFPIADIHGNIVGLTSRILSDSKTEAKYVNTPETAIYRKSAVLYGLDKAKGEIRRGDLAVIVEGNMDVIASHQFGIANVVASSGTALTGEQLKLLKRFTTNLAIAFDADAAGQAATVRGLDAARALDFNIKIITLPPDAGKDPDDAVRKNPQIWKDAIKNAAGIMEWIYRGAFKNRHAENPEDKKQIAKDVLAEIKRIADPVERDHWLKRLARDLGASESALQEAMGRSSNTTRTTQHAPPSPPPNKLTPNQLTSSPPPHNQELDIERQFMAFLVFRAHFVELAAGEFDVKPEEFVNDDLSTLYKELKNLYTQPHINTSPDYSGQTIRLPAGLTPAQTTTFQALAFLAEREFEGQSMDAMERDFKQSVALFRQNRKARMRKHLEDEMREAERIGATARISELLKQFDQWR